MINRVQLFAAVTGLDVQRTTARSRPGQQREPLPRHADRVQSACLKQHETKGMSRLYGVNFTLTARSSLASTMRTPRRSRASFTLSTTCSSVHSKAWRRFALRMEDEMRRYRAVVPHKELQKPSDNLVTSDSGEDRQQTAEELETRYSRHPTGAMYGPVRARGGERGAGTAAVTVLDVSDARRPFHKLYQ
ncbi:hypothetical protein FQA47_023066 [Oryzias melastigma]|uniref:Uncharacterized protein n=1 Tax=Oryzias melastigma TaxID=30732 RepID=A0A834FFA2_ORYME|nr:hypothetical protein FQA47_023066 [Oryzias melastigma]